MRKLLHISLILAALTQWGCGTTGVKVVEGTDLTLGMSLPGTDGEVTMTLFNWLSGFKFESADSCRMKLWYDCSETNSYFGVVNTRVDKHIAAAVEPVEEGDGEPGGALGITRPTSGERGGALGITRPTSAENGRALCPQSAENLSTDQGEEE